MTRNAMAGLFEVTAPLADLPFPLEVELARLSIEIEGSPLGEIELPVCDGCLPAGVIADAVAAEHAWTILGRFFDRTVFPALELSVRRGDFRLWQGEALTAGAWLDRIGWQLFLQDLRGRRTGPRSGSTRRRRMSRKPPPRYRSRPAGRRSRYQGLSPISFPWRKARAPPTWRWRSGAR